jgi:hypothetical protein
MTQTSGDDPKANGRAEAGVGIYKLRTKILLKAAKLDSSHWCYAVTYESERQFAEFFKMDRPEINFGQYVTFKEHAFQVNGKKNFEDVSKPGKFLGWCPDSSKRVCFIKTEDRITRTTTVAPLKGDIREGQEEAPRGWTVKKDPEGKRFYENENGEVQWQFPVEIVEEAGEEKGNEEFKEQEETTIPKRRLRGKQTVTGEVQKRMTETQSGGEQEDEPPGLDPASSDDDDDGPPGLESESSDSDAETKRRHEKLKKMIQEEEKESSEEGSEDETRKRIATMYMKAKEEEKRVKGLKRVVEKKIGLVRQYFRKSTKHPTEDRVYAERGEEGDETPSSEESGEDDVEGRKMRALLSEYIYENRILLSIRIPLILLRIRI